MSRPPNQPVSNGSSSRMKSKTLGHYILGKTLGEGTFGKVKLGTHILTGEKVAVKILEKEKINEVADVERVMREIHILKMIRHPQIIQLYEIIETSRQLYLIMEYASGGELFDYIVAHGRVKEKEACRFFQQIISGVEYIHKLRVVHRDLKPENLLLDFNKGLKIVDFGLSNMYKNGELLKTACGSPCYAAPEMIAGKKYNGLNVDIWSCGVILFALLCGYLPFEDPNTAQLYKKILSADYSIPKFVSPEGKDMIKNILNTDPTKRYTINDIRKHPWFSLVKPKEQQEGIIVGINQIPVDIDILGSLEQFGYSLEYTSKCIEANKHNHVTTAYYLLLKRHLKNGGTSIADLSSTQYEEMLALKAAKANLNQTAPNPTAISKHIFNDSITSNPKSRKNLDSFPNSKMKLRSGSTGGSSTNEECSSPNKDILNGTVISQVNESNLVLAPQKKRKSVLPEALRPEPLKIEDSKGEIRVAVGELPRSSSNKHKSQNSHPNANNMLPFGLNLGSLNTSYNGTGPINFHSKEPLNLSINVGMNTTTPLPHKSPAKSKPVKAIQQNTNLNASYQHTVAQYAAMKKAIAPKEPMIPRPLQVSSRTKKVRTSSRQDNVRAQKHIYGGTAQNFFTLRIKTGRAKTPLSIVDPNGSSDLSITNPNISFNFSNAKHHSPRATSAFEPTAYDILNQSMADRRSNSNQRKGAPHPKLSNGDIRIKMNGKSNKRVY